MFLKYKAGRQGVVWRSSEALKAHGQTNSGRKHASPQRNPDMLKTPKLEFTTRLWITLWNHNLTGLFGLAGVTCALLTFGCEDVKVSPRTSKSWVKFFVSFFFFFLNEFLSDRPNKTERYCQVQTTQIHDDYPRCWLWLIKLLPFVRIMTRK